MYELKKKIGKVFTGNFVRNKPLSYEKSNYLSAISQKLKNTAVGHLSRYPARS
jgi:hypothetical protein